MSHATKFLWRKKQANKLETVSATKPAPRYVMYPLAVRAWVGLVVALAGAATATPPRRLGNRDCWRPMITQTNTFWYVGILE